MATVYAWVTPLLPSFLAAGSEIPMTAEEASYMIAVLDVGVLFSALPGGVLSDCVGRKLVLLSSAPLTLLGWLIILYYRMFWALVVARIFQGFAVGIVYTVLPIYLGEISIPKYRGAVTSSFYIFWWLGYLFEYVVGCLMSFNGFTYVTASVNIVFFFAFLCVPETPYYYIMKNDEHNARKSLSWLFCTTEEETDKELDRMRQGDKRKKAAWKDLVSTATNRKAMTIILLNGYARVFCGLLPLSTYSTWTLASSGGEFFISPENVTIIMGVMMFVGGVCSTFTLDSFGRKPLLLYSSLISTITMLLVAIFYYLNSNTSADVTSLNWVPSVGLIVFSVVAVIGIFPVSIAYQSELFDSSTRATASIVLNIFTTVIGVVIYKFYLTISISLGTYVDFLIFTASCFISFLSALFIMPETKGKSFEQIVVDLHKKK